VVRSVHRLSRWQRQVLYAAGLVLLVTGVAWLALHYGRGDESLPSALEPWAMRLHGLAALAVVFTFGALAASHIPHGWRWTHRLRWAQQRASGVALCTLAAGLVLTGYLLYYFAPDNVRPALGWLHSVLGVAMAALVVAHRRRARRRRLA
jgi:hypothetical protein